MGLDTTHDCWHGPYGSFMRWRRELAEVAGYGDLDSFWKRRGEPWPAEDPLILLLDHSDCDGYIHHALCEPIADRLDEMIPHLSPESASRAEQFAIGLRDAASEGQTVEFR